MITIKHRIKPAALLTALLLLFFAEVTASSLEFKQENIGGSMQGLILISYNDFFTQQTDEKIEIENYLSVSLVTDKQEVVFQEEFQISMSVMLESLQGYRYLRLFDEYYPVRFTADINPGEYELIVMLNARIGAQKRSYRENITFPQEEKRIGSSLLVAHIEDFKFALRDSRYLVDSYDNIQLWQHYSEQPDTTKIVMTIGERQLSKSLAEIGSLYQDLQEAEDFAIEVKNEYNGHSYSTKPVFPTVTFFFNQRFTPEQQLAQLRNILNHNQYRDLRAKEGEELMQGIDEYWESVDTDAYSVDNYYQRIFYNRVMYADRNFGVRGYLQGWETDRGKIYIKYGPPDAVTTDAFPVGRSPSITWRYYSLNKTFTFYDLRGYGQYELRQKWMD